jgi:TldD protein
LLGDVLARVTEAGVQPATVRDAAAAAASVDVDDSVRFEFELQHRRALVCSDEQPDGTWVEHGGVRCRVIADSADGTCAGRAYTEARSHDVRDLDLAGAMTRAQAEARDIANGTRLESAERLPVLLSPSVTAALLHETCGHALEADVSADSGTCLADRSGERVAVETLSVLDDPLRTDLWGGYEWDDEGTRAQQVPLIEEGRVGEALRGAATAGTAASNGHGRRMSHQWPAVPRMSNLVVVPGEATLEQLCRDADGGILVDTVERARLVPRQGVVLLHGRTAHRLRDGQPGEPIAGVVIKAPFRELLASISDVGADCETPSGYCRKGDQRIPFGASTPVTRLSEILVIPY